MGRDKIFLQLAPVFSFFGVRQQLVSHLDLPNELSDSAAFFFLPNPCLWFRVTTLNASPLVSTAAEESEEAVRVTHHS